MGKPDRSNRYLLSFSFEEPSIKLADNRTKASRKFARKSLLLSREDLTKDLFQNRPPLSATRKDSFETFRLSSEMLNSDEHRIVYPARKAALLSVANLNYAERLNHWKTVFVPVERFPCRIPLLFIAEDFFHS